MPPRNELVVPIVRKLGPSTTAPSRDPARLRLGVSCGEVVQRLILRSGSAAAHEVNPALLEHTEAQHRVMDDLGDRA